MDALALFVEKKIAVDKIVKKMYVSFNTLLSLKISHLGRHATLLPRGRVT